MKIVIMAGGKGTRIASINAEVPKPMIPILDKPILEYQIENLKAQGYTDFIIVVGHLGHVILEYFGDGSGISPATGEPFDVHIKYIVENKPLGTAGSLYLLKEELLTDKDGDFLLLNGDIIFNINVKQFFQFHKAKGGVATLFTHPNNHPYDSGIILAYKNGKVKNWLHKEENRNWYQNRVNAGIHMFSNRIFEGIGDYNLFQELKKVDLDRDVLKPLIHTGQLYVYDSPEYVKDMGTPDRLCSVTDDIKTGKIQDKNLTHKQKAIFLDRDGTINKYVGFLTNINDFELINGVPEAVKKINLSGYLVIVVTNQPVIARGEVSLDELQEIHNKMETLLGQQGAYLDAIYYCPHHPCKGYEGERTEYKIECNCRKPKPGMLLDAKVKYNIDLSQSWMIGDGEKDIGAGRNAGCQVAYIGSEAMDGVQSYGSLLQFVEKILG